MFAIAMAGCGKKARPIPNDATVPRAVKNFKLEKLDGIIRLSWEAPTKDLRGGKLKNLTGYKVLRKIVKPGSNDCIDCPAGFSVVAVLDLDHPVNFKEKDEMTVWEDRDIKKKGIYVYRVLPFNANGYDGTISGYVSVKID
jgi:hypothetical protein